jgi:hypothetical protein
MAIYQKQHQNRTNADSRYGDGKWSNFDDTVAAPLPLLDYSLALAAVRVRRASATYLYWILSLGGRCVVQADDFGVKRFDFPNLLASNAKP